jgi:Mn2+/Fe2+ NRAMP family transporter
MLFLYPYSLLARGWGREHRRMARFDLYLGMFVPYLLATSLMVIATANTLHVDGSFQGKSLSPSEAAGILAQAVGPTIGRVIFNLGVLGMALSSITLQMLCAGFVCVELFGWKVGSWRYHLGTLLPAPGFLGAVFWNEIAVWVAVPTNILCGFLLPIAYVGFILLQKNRDYLKDDLPTGLRGRAWIGAMVLSSSILIVFLAWYAWTKGPAYFERLF